MFKKILFQLHWLLGISAGAVLALMGLTGATLAFEDEALHALNPSQAEIAQRHARGEAPLPLPELVRRLGIGPEQGLSRLSVDPTGARLSRLRAERQGVRTALYFDPYTGQRLAEPRGAALFEFVEDLHRRLAAGERGKAVTGVCVITLLFFCLSGLYLRWPRQWWHWRAWAVVEWRRQGRSFLWSLHSVVGTWCLLLYLVIALTGLYWSYDWYRTGLTRLLGGTPPASAGQGPRGDARARLELARVQVALDAIPGLERDFHDLRWPARGAQVTVRYRSAAAAHSRAYDLIEIDGASGRVLRSEPYAEQAAGKQLLGSIFALHSGSFFGLPGRIAWMLASLCMPLFFVTGWLLYLDRRRKQRALREVRHTLAPVADATGGESWLIGFASQSGFAERLAWHAAGQLRAVGVPAQVRPLAQLDPATLGATRRALFVVSTFGDGEPPDAARGVEKTLLRQAQALPDLDYALLALGDRQYARFCGFSRRLEDWLAAQGARALFPTVEVDNADPQALAQWQQHLSGLTGAAATAFDPQRPAFAGWRLRGRHWLNPGSEGGEVWRIDLAPPPDTHWQAGDILEIQPQQAPDAVRACLLAWRLEPGASVRSGGRVLTLAEAAALHTLPPMPTADASPPAPQAWLDALRPLGTREYSIASVAADGVLQLVVRQVRDAAGRPGLGSGWLALHAPIGAEVLA
ncbi:MAG: PepSY domain-containing protein, partial [Pseudomonas sp.]